MDGYPPGYPPRTRRLLSPSRIAVLLVLLDVVRPPRARVGVAATAAPTAAPTYTGGGDGGYIYGSADGGATWAKVTSPSTITTADTQWNGMAISADGSKVVAVGVNGGGSSAGGYVYTLERPLPAPPPSPPRARSAAWVPAPSALKSRPISAVSRLPCSFV